MPYPSLIELLLRAESNGWSDYAIARELGVTRSAISGVRNSRHGLSWQKARMLEELSKIKASQYHKPAKKDPPERRVALHK